MNRYQTIKKYTGELNANEVLDSFVNDGIAYDWEVPNNMVIGTPGGVSTIHHHPTHGIYGRGWTSSDIYGGDNPRYIAGNYDNLYRPGQSAPFNSGQYKTYPNATQVLSGMGGASGYNMEHARRGIPLVSNPSGNSFGGSPGGAPNWNSPSYGGPSFQQIQNIGVPKKTSIFPSEGPWGVKSPEIETDVSSGISSLKENYNNDKVFELVENSGVKDEKDDLVDILIKEKRTTKNSPWLVFFFFIFVFVCFGMWATTGDMFIRQQIHKGEEISWTRYAFYSLTVTVIFIIAVWATGFSLGTFESL